MANLSERYVQEQVAREIAKERERERCDGADVNYRINFETMMPPQPPPLMLMMMLRKQSAHFGNEK